MNKNNLDKSFTIQDLNKIVTTQDLNSFSEEIINKVINYFTPILPQQKVFLTPKEFASVCGLKYSTVIYKCKTGVLKARQDGANCCWQISTEELKRYKKEAESG